ncbi:MAG: SufE family protein [Rickettsiales bacterium]|nr:SufE family protein [Rickettsiales bacterium]
MDKEIKQIIDEFEMFSDWQEKYSYIIDIGKKLPELDESQKIDANKVSGCVSQVWLIFSRAGNKYYFNADSDALIVKGLLAIVLRVFSGKTKEQIINTNFQELFEKLDLNNHLTPTRSNGLFAVVNKIVTSVS